VKFLLDTQLILWWQGMTAQVPTEARTLVEAPNDGVFVSRASLWEIAIKTNQGKLKLDVPLFCKQVAIDGFAWLAIENDHLLRVATLPLFDDHKDPFDRLLFAQSEVESAALLTTDAKLARYGPRVRVL
jgi:PIN domain nuclease of toxin-antitoxin system